MYSHIKNSAEGRVMKLEDRSVEITQIISQRKKEKYKEVKRHGEENEKKKVKHTLIVILI